MMKVIKKAIIQGKEIQLLLMDDERTIKLFCEDEVISVSSDGTWNNIKNEEWAQEGLLKIEAESYIKKKAALKKLKDMAQDVF